MLPAPSLERHHLEHKNLVAEIIEKIGIPVDKCVLVGSGSIAQQVFEQFTNRRPNDLDFYITDPLIWAFLKTIGTEVPGTIENSVIQLSINGVDIEFFQYLPGLPDRRVKNVFKNAQWKNGVLCMSLADITVWKWHLSRMEKRSPSKKENDRKDMARAIKKMVKDMFIGQISFQRQLITQDEGLLN